MFKESISRAQAVGQGEWTQVIEMYKDILEKEDYKAPNYTMIGYAYAALEDIENAKKYYHLALEDDKNFLLALEKISVIYASENSSTLAYDYIERGLANSKYEIDTFTKIGYLISAILLKVLRPTKSWTKIRNESSEDMNSHREWITWALEYKNWYEKNH